MKVAIFSDSHDNMHNVILAYQKAKKLGAERIIFLGDLNAPFMIKLFKKFDMPVHCIWGNNEGDRAMNIKFSEGSKITYASSTHDETEIDGKKIFLTHYPSLVDQAVKSGMYDAVFYGHNHTKFKEKKQNVLILNPGALFGSPEIISFAIYDSEKNDAEIIELDGVVIATDLVKNYS